MWGGTEQGGVLENEAHQVGGRAARTHTDPAASSPAQAAAPCPREWALIHLIRGRAHNL